MTLDDRVFLTLWIVAEHSVKIILQFKNKSEMCNDASDELFSSIPARLSMQNPFP